MSEPSAAGAEYKATSRCAIFFTGMMMAVVGFTYFGARNAPEREPQDPKKLGMEIGLLWKALRDAGAPMTITELYALVKESHDREFNAGRAWGTFRGSLETAILVVAVLWIMSWWKWIKSRRSSKPPNATPLTTT